MFGKTNSVMASSAASGGGDEIVAVNNKDNLIECGDKVWLNRRVYSADIGGRIDGTTNSGILAYNIKNKFYCHHVAKIIRADFNGEGWQFPEINSCETATPQCVRFRDGKVIETLHGVAKSLVFGDMGNFVLVDGKVVDTNHTIVSNKICSFNPSSGEILVEGGVINSVNSAVNVAYKSGNVLFVMLVNKKYYFYDVSDITQPVELKSGSFSGDEVPMYMTGLNAGDYLLARCAASSVLEWSTSVSLKIFQIGEGYTINVPTDLPAGLNAYLGKSCRITYNNDTGVLGVGSELEVKFFRLVNGKFLELDLNLPQLPPTKSNQPFIARLSDDMSTLAITSTDGGSGTYYRMWFYRLSQFNETWYAEDFADATASSLIGFAKENAQSGEEFVVKTVMPQSYTLTVEAPDYVEISVKGVR